MFKIKIVEGQIVPADEFSFRYFIESNEGQVMELSARVWDGRDKGRMRRYFYGVIVPAYQQACYREGDIITPDEAADRLKKRFLFELDSHGEPAYKGIKGSDFTRFHQFINWCIIKLWEFYGTHVDLPPDNEKENQPAGATRGNNFCHRTGYECVLREHGLCPRGVCRFPETMEALKRNRERGGDK